MPPSTIRVQSPGGRITMHVLEQGETVIGRDASAGLVLDDARISRRHAVLTRTGAGVVVADLGSRNGTFLNGTRIEGGARALAAGDVLEVGDFTLVFEPQDAILFAQDPAVADMRAVLHKAPDEVIHSGVARGCRRGPRRVGRRAARRAREEDARARALLRTQPHARLGLHPR